LIRPASSAGAPVNMVVSLRERRWRFLELCGEVGAVSYFGMICHRRELSASFHLLDIAVTRFGTVRGL